MDCNLSLIELSKEYSMLVERLYRLGKDGILKLCVDGQEATRYLEQAHIAMDNFHMSPK